MQYRYQTEFTFTYEDNSYLEDNPNISGPFYNETIQIEVAFDSSFTDSLEGHVSRLDNLEEPFQGYVNNYYDRRAFTAELKPTESIVLSIVYNCEYIDNFRMLAVDNFGPTLLSVFSQPLNQENATGNLVISGKEVVHEVVGSCPSISQPFWGFVVVQVVLLAFSLVVAWKTLNQFRQRAVDK